LAGAGSGVTTGGIPLANVAGRSIEAWNYGRVEPGQSDGVPYTAPGGRFPANARGLSDMHGNVAEWCLSTYRPYPYRPADARDDPRTSGPKVVRGGSWSDTFRQATSASR
jgi:formylglycine-generating enzyme required for sulfatase activity